MALTEYQHIQALAAASYELGKLTADFRSRYPDEGPAPSWAMLARYTSDLEAAVDVLEKARAEATR